MNITEYISGNEKTEMYHGRMTLKHDYGIINADESVYRYVGVNSARPVTVAIHPEDLASFHNAMAKLEQEPQHLVIRLLDCENRYRYMYLLMRHNSRLADGEPTTDIEMMDIVQTHEKVESLHDSVLKYRKLMTLSNNLYFEYYYDTQTIKIYEYINSRSLDLFCGSLEETREKVHGSDKGYSHKQLLEFDALYDSLIGSADNIDMMVDGSIFGMDGCILKLQGGILYQADKKEMLIAVVTKLTTEDMGGEEKYYTTSYAIDAGTSVYNKRAISELSVDIIARAEGRHCYIIMMDVDDFKTINDTYGHMTGDVVLAKVAEIIKSVLGDRGYVGRFGGDEFFIITDDVESDEDIVYVLKTIRKHIDWSCKEIVESLAVKTSIGIAKYPENGSTYEELLRIADKCLYIAKAKGKNRYILYNPEKHGEVEEQNSEGHLSVAGLFDNNYQMCSAAYHILQHIHLSNQEELPVCLDEVRRTFDLDGITVYAGEDFERKYTSGRYVNPMERADFLNTPDGKALLDANGLVSVNKAISIKERCPILCERMERQDTSGFILVKGDGTASELPVAVCFEVFSRPRKWSDNDRGLLLIIAKSLIETVRRMQM